MQKSHQILAFTTARTSAKPKLSTAKRSYLGQARLIAACALAAGAVLVPGVARHGANAATITWTDSSGNHTWSDNANWSPTGTPTTTSDVIIGSPASAATPSLDDFSVTIANLTVNTSSELDVAANIDLDIGAGGTVTDNGTIKVNATGANSGTGIGITGAVLLTGSGNLVLNANSANLGTANIFNNGSSNLTQDTNHTISGTGEITVVTFNNNGTVNANSNGNTLLLQNTLNNTGTMEATSGGILELTGTTTNTGGTILADGGNVLLEGGTVTGGTLTSTSGSEINEQGSTTLDNVTISSGSNVVVLHGNNLYFSDPSNSTKITNNGTITLNDNAADTGTGIGIVHNVELAGSGSIVLNAFAGNVGTANIFDGGSSNLTQDAGHTISGTGEITVNSFTNSGTVNADSNGNTLQLSNTNTNQGTYESTLGGTLNVFNLTNYSSANGGTLTGGIYKAIDTGSSSPSTISLNSGNIAVNAADVTISGTNSVFAQINSLSVNQGEFRVLNNRNFTAQAAFDNQTGALLQLGGGTFNVTTSPLTNEGTVQGFGTVTPQVTNTGLIEATGGTLALSNGALDPGTGSTLQSDAGATLDLSGGATSSTTQYLVNNGNLILGNNNVTVSVDYTNANFGIGNSFNNHANVSSTGGQILASGNVAMTVTNNTTSATGSAITLNLGNIHVGSSTSQTFNVNNTGTTGPVLRGAIQTTSLTDSRISLTGGAQNFGPLALGGTSGPYSVQFNAASDGSLSSQSIKVVSNFDNVASDTVNVTGTAWNLAAAAVTPTTINLGNIHVGGAVTQNVGVSNTALADGFSEQLDGQLGSGSGNLSTNLGTFSGLAAGSSLTPANALTVTLDTSAAGVRTGSATLALQSDGAGTSGLGITNLTPQTITMSATAYRLANPVVNSPAGTTINLGVIHVGDVGTQNISLTNSVPNDGFSENLDASVGSLTGSAFAVTNPNPVVLTPGSTNTPGSLQVGVSTAVAGSKSGTATLNLISDGTGIDSLGKTTLTPIVYNVSATVNNYALPTILLQSGSSGAVLHEISSTQYSLNLGTTAQGAGNLFADLGFGNGATGPSDTLAGNFILNAASFNLSGFNNFSGIGAGQNTTGQDVTLSDLAAGNFSGSITYNPFGQNSSGYNSAFLPITIDISGTVTSSTPEPTALAMLAVGGVALLIRRRKTT